MKSRSSKSASSKRWVARQKSDPYVQRAQKNGLRSRAVFKIEQLDARDRLFRPGQRIIDLGAAPGGWSQYLAGKMAGNGTVVAVDLLPMSPIAGVDFIRGDFLDARVVQRVLGTLNGERVDVVVSDMAPKLSGIRDRDAADSRHLAEAALAFAEQVLRPGGAMVVKVFEGFEKEEIVAAFKARFARIQIRKPDASRSASAECYLVAKGYNGPIGVPENCA